MEQRQDELRTMAVPFCGSLVGAFTFPLTVLALQYCLRHEPLWFSIAGRSQGPGYVLNPYYWPTNLALSLGPPLGCLASVLALPNRDFKIVGLLRYGLACLIGYFSLSFLGIVLNMKVGFHSYLLCAVSWAAAIGMCLWAKYILRPMKSPATNNSEATSTGPLSLL